MNWGLLGVIGVLGLSGSGRIGVAGLSAAEDQVFSVGGPKGAGLHEAGIVRAGEGPQLLFFAVVPGEDSTSWIENLTEAEIVIAGAEEAVRETGGEAGMLVLMGVSRAGGADGCDDVAAVRRDLRHEPEALDGWLGVPEAGGLLKEELQRMTS